MSYLCADFTMFVSHSHTNRLFLSLLMLLSAVMACADNQLDTLKIETDTITLRELTVTGALHPVVQRGDTLIYDVASFPLPEGSRLRELLLRLPGIEVTADGVITAQGKPISYLLLNGREFFSGNRSIVLDNLPAGVLLDVKIYERVQKDEEDTGIRSRTDRVMDLTTMPDNNRGWFADVTGAGGYDRRYSVNANASRFDEQYQHMISASADNLPEAFGLGESFYDKLEKSSQTGDSHHRNVSVILGRKTSHWDTSGSISYTNTKTDQGAESFTEHFLTTGRLFSRTSSEGVDRTHAITASGHIERRDSMTTITFDPQVSWSKQRSENKYLGASSTRALNEVLEWDDLAFSPFLLNRQTTANSDDTRVWDASLTARLRRRLSAKGRALTATVSWSLTDMNSHASSFAETKYYRTESDERQSRYSDAPDRDQQVNVRVAWIEPISKYVKLKGEYGFSFRHERIQEKVFADSVYSPQRSRDATYRFINQIARLLVQWSPSEELFLSIGGHYNPVASSINYRKEGFELKKTRRVDNLAPELNFYYRSKHGWNLTAQYSGSTRQPSLLSLLPIVDDTDPLHLRVGNPGLKPSFLHQVNTTFFYFDQNSQTQVNLQGIGQWEVHAMTDVVEVDPVQGIRRTSVTNVEGCRQFGGSWNISSDFVPGSHWTLDFQGDLTHARRVGIQEERENVTSATSSSIVDKPFVTHQTLLRQYIGLQWHPGIVSVKPYGFCSYNGVRTRLLSKDPSNLWLLGVGLLFRLESLNGWSAAIDASRQSRRGFTEAVDNDDEWLVDFEVAYAFLKGRSAEVRLQVCDLLRQHSFARTATSAAERVEATYPHSVTNYILLSFTYRFSLMGR